MMRRTGSLSLAMLTIWIGCLGPSVLGAACPERVGHWPYGSTLGVAVLGDHVAFGAGTVLRIADISDPAAPQVVGEVRLSNLIRGLAVSGTTVLAAASERGVVAVDVSDPEAPTVVGTLAELDLVIDVAVSDQIAWAATRDTGLVAIDISDPADMQLAGSLIGIGSAWGVAVSGILAVVASSNQGLVTVDVTNPHHPTQLGLLELDHAVGVALAGEYAYVADQFQGLEVVDIGAPSTPELVATLLEDTDYCYRARVSGGLLLVANRLDGVAVLDLSDPAAPVEVGRLDTSGQARDMEQVGDLLLVADEFEGLTVANIANPAEPEHVASIAGMGELKWLAVEGSVAVATTVGELDIFDLRDPSDPIRLATWDGPGWIEGVALAEGRAYLAEYRRGLRILDLSDPAAPTELGVLLLPNARWVASDGTVAVLASETDGLRVVDVSDPAAPVALGRLALDYSPEGLVVAGHAAYVSDYQVGLHVVDLSTPASPTEVALIPMNGASHANTVSGDRLVVGDQGFGVRLFDISDPLAPVELGSDRSTTYFGGIGSAGNLLGVASIYSGFLVLDASNPADIGNVGSHELAADVEGDAAAVGNLVLVTEKGTGLEIFDLAGCPGGAPAAGFTWAPPLPEAGWTVRLSDTSVGGITTWAWDLGDGQRSDARNPAHVWAAPGSYEVTLSVAGPEGIDSLTRTVVVAESTTPPITDPGDLVWVVPASAHIAGALGTSWVTDLVLHNPGADDAVANLYFMAGGRDNSGEVATPVVVPAAGVVELEDVVLGLFAEEEAAGAILVGADAPLVISSRTYNDAPSGTYGQFIPGLAAAGAVGPNDSARLIQLQRSADFRTNLGVANPTGAEVEVAVQLLDADAAELGVRTVVVPAFGYHQVNDVLGVDADDAMALVSSGTSDAAYFAYASVVDNHTGDPVLVLPVEAAGEVYVPAAAHADGYEGTQWRTDLEVFNGDAAEVGCTVELLATGQANPAPPSADLLVAPGAAVRVSDVLDQLFGVAGTGALRVTAGSEQTMVISRTYNWTPAGTYGQAVPGTSAEGAIGPGEVGRLVPLHQSTVDDTGYRTNLGLVNVTSAPVEVEVVFFDSAGVELGWVTATLRAHEHMQLNRVLRSITFDEVRSGFAELSTSTDGGRFLAYASVVDNGSGDPVYVPMR